MPEFESSVFVNCPFDDEFAPLLEVMLFCIVRSGLSPQLASERLEAGENRLDKIMGMIASSKYSIHDLSRAAASRKGEVFRMNMPFELGLDMGYRKCTNGVGTGKKFIVFEKTKFELKKCLSDLAGTDVSYHRGDFKLIFKSLRDFFVVEAGCALPGPSAIEGDYYTFQAWMVEKKMFEGHTEQEAVNLPTAERLNEMKTWMQNGRPVVFTPA